MSAINQIKKEINTAIFCATPSEWIDVDNPHEWNSLKFASEISSCQTRINSIKGNKNFSEKDGDEKLKELKEKVNEKIKELKDELKEAKGDVKNDLELRISDLESALTELDKLITVSTKYKYVVNKTAPQLNYDPNTDTAIIQYDGTTGGLLNELKHAFQFETGKIDFIQINDNGVSKVIPGLTYDLNDEIETYKRQYAYDGVLKFRVELEEDFENLSAGEKFQKLQKELNSVVEIKKMKKIKASIIVKISDGSLTEGLYKNLPKKSLDIHSSIEQIPQKK